MSSSSINITAKKSVLMAHVCSQCGFPMFSVVEIEVKTQKRYTMFASKAETEAREAAEFGVNRVIRSIESCKDSKSVLSGMQNKNETIDIGFFRSVKSSGYNALCPYCLNAEPWQLHSNTKSMEELSDENFPLVFTDTNKAIEWANEKVRKQIQVINGTRENKEAVVNAIVEKMQSEDSIKRLEKELINIPEQKEKARVNDELKALTKEQANISVFNLKRKKELKTKKEELEKQLYSLNRILTEKTTPIMQQLKQEDRKLLASKAIAYGCQEEIKCKSLLEAFVFLYTPYENGNDVEAEALALMEYGDRVKRSSNEKTTKTESTEEGESLYCRKCGTRLPPDSVFCKKCGAEVI